MARGRRGPTCRPGMGPGAGGSGRRRRCPTRNNPRGSPPMARRLFFILCPILFAGVGCSTSGINVTLDTWKEGVEQYVRDVGKGDPVVLRDATYKGRPAFAQIGHPVSSEGTDAVGVLLGHRPIGGRPAFIYLVGLVHL